MLSILINPDCLQKTFHCHQLVDGFVAYTKACPPLELEQPVIMPGDIERRLKVERENDEIPVDDQC